MANRRVTQKASQEQYFFEYVDQLDRHRAARLALVVTLSGINTSRALQSTQNLVRDHIKRHMGSQNYEMFNFERGDIAIITKDVNPGFIKDMAFGLIFQLKDEAFFGLFKDGEGDLCRLLSVENDYKDLMYYAKAALHEGPLELAGKPMEAVGRDGGENDRADEHGKDMSPFKDSTIAEDQHDDDNRLVTTYVDAVFGDDDGEIDTRPANAGLETRRDEIIQIEGQSKPKIVMSLFAADEIALKERFLEFADEDTREAYLPGILQEAEQQLLARLSKEDPHLLPEHMLVGMQVKTLLSASFLSFDRMRANTSILPRSILVLDRQDMRANSETFKFARDFVEGRGHKLALKGLNFHSLSKVRLKPSGFIYQFVEWNSFEASLITKKEQAVLRAGVEDEASAITVLTHCDEEEAIEFGRAIGITLFEGRMAAAALTHMDYA